MADKENETRPPEMTREIAAAVEEVSEPIKETIVEKSDDVDSSPPPPVSEVVERSVPSVASSQPRSRRLFGREKPVHEVFGGGKTADVLLWRDKKSAVGALAGATAIWVLFEVLNYRLLALLSHCFMFALGGFFIVSKLMSWINRSPPKIPEVHIPEEQARHAALAFRNDINRVLSLLRDVALGRDLKKFLMVIAGLWVLSIVGSWFDFLTLSYIGFILLHTVPALYEKYEDKVDEIAERGLSEANKHYKVLDEKVLSKIPRGPAKSKKYQ
ncbi:Reticulon-like protein [Rhynchospora pubera]|uniref:Reticulon-like protein n=1 Tax=Rhynchospora pubera TaxID=906938 RepID=A0AAV8DN92_9POAL|nr:Reticulon-like protein [Rhynchospora pubera]KAJ4770152.1 Reticulon-like protein [Rhynchospora pubera]KAJ4781911.1 Reticulon-like protein [Rhynchospora pubera]